MHKKIKNKIGETLFLTLYLRCRETQKKNAIINDKEACKLVSQIDYDFSKFNKSILSATGIVLRSRYFDNKVKEFIQNKDNPVVVIIGCGLDTRFKRLGKVSEKATFYELDIPEVMQLRETLLPNANNDIYISSSMLETKWMDDIKKHHPNGNFIFVIEGVFMYFVEKDIRLVLTNLSNRFSNGVIHFDIGNKWWSKNTHKNDSVKYTDAVFKFGIDDDKEIENWNINLKHQSTQLYVDFKEWKRIGLVKAFIMKLIPRYKNASRMLCYKIKNTYK